MNKPNLLAVVVALAMPACAMPEFWLPEHIYAAPGLECNVYFGETFFSVTPWNYAIQASAEKGRSQVERWTYTPADEDAGKSFQLVLNAWTDAGLAASATATVHVAAAPTRRKAKLTLALFSDSTTNCRWQDRLYAVMQERGFTGYTPVGARQSENPKVMYDGYGGYSFDSFLERYRFSEEEVDNVQDAAEREQMLRLGKPEKVVNVWQRALLRSPLVRLVNGQKVVDVAAWKRKVNGGADPDVILIQLGCNSCFTLRGEEAELRRHIAENVMPKAQEFLDTLRAACPTSRYFFMNELKGSSQDGFAANYGAKWNRVQFTKIILALDKETKAFVDRQADPQVGFVPFAHGIDPDTSFFRKTEPINAHSKEKRTRDCNAVHCAAVGGLQLGDTVAAWLLNDWDKLTPMAGLEAN